MRIFKLTLMLASLTLVSAAFAFAAPLGATTGDPVGDEITETDCLFDDTTVDEEEPADEEGDFALHTGDTPREEPAKTDTDEDAEPEDDEGFDEDVFCGEGDDELFLGEGDDKIHLGGGDDDAELGDGDDVGHGDDGDDELHGGPGDDDLFGEGGNDGVYGDRGQDDLSGGTGRRPRQGRGRWG